MRSAFRIDEKGERHRRAKQSPVRSLICAIAAAEAFYYNNFGSKAPASSN
jgi:hypothetical protein